MLTGFQQRIGAHAGLLLLLLLVAVALGPSPARARDVPQARTAAGGTLTGKLPNGLAYHIERVGGDNAGVSFRLVVRVGHFHGLPEQQVAHVIEHIVTEKLRDVPLKGTVWQRVGRWGGSINASTGDRETLYVLDLPTGDSATALEGLSIVADWASAGELTDAEIERERLAVIEEARRGGYGEENRLQAAQLRILYPDDPLVRAERDPIGTLNASAKSIRSIYRRYYVPSNMAIIVTGDIDPASILRRISSILGSLPGDDTVPVAKIEKAPKRGGGHYLAEARRELDETHVEIIYKLKPSPSVGCVEAREAAMARVVEMLFRDAFRGLAARRETITEGLVTWTRQDPGLGRPDIVAFRSAVPRRGARDALRDMLALIATVRRDGFPAADVEAIKQVLLERPPGAPSPAQIAGRWSTFFAGGQFPPSEECVRNEVARISAAEIKRWLRRTLRPMTRDIFIFYPAVDKETVPTPKDVSVLADAAATAPAVDFSMPGIREPLLDREMESGNDPLPAIVEDQDYQRWRLPASGATLLFRKTGAGPLRLVIARAGGAARFKGPAAARARAAPDIVRNSGLGGLPRPELDRFLTAHEIQFSVAASAEREQLLLSGPAREWPLMLRLARTQLTRPQCSADALRAYVDREAARRRSVGPNGDDMALEDLIEETTGGKRRFDLEGAEGLRLEEACQQFAAMFGDTSASTIAIEGPVGDRDVVAGAASMLDVAPRAARPALHPSTVQETRAARLVLRRGNAATAKVVLIIAAAGQREGTGLLSDMLQRRLFERLRTVEMGTYNPRAGISARPAPERTIFSLAFECSPDNVDRLVEAAKEEIERFGREGPTTVEMAGARANMGAPRLDPRTIAELWIAKGSLAAPRVPSDDEVRRWSRDFFQRSKITEFILFPQD